MVHLPSIQRWSWWHDDGPFCIEVPPFTPLFPSFLHHFQLILSSLIVSGDPAAVSVKELSIYYLYGSGSLELLGLPMARRLRFGPHVVVHALGLASVMRYNGDVCATMARYPAAPRLLGGMYNAMRLIAAAVAAPLTPPEVFFGQAKSEEQQCMVVTGVLQVVLGFAVPTLLLLVLEASEVSRFAERHGRGMKPTSMHDRCLLWFYKNIWGNTNTLVRVMLGLMTYSIVCTLFLLAY